LIRLLNS